MGYINEGVTKDNFNALGISFTAVDGKGFNPDTLTGAGVYGSTDPQTADQIWIWNPLTSGYEKWYYYYDAGDHSYDGWWDVATATKTFGQVHPNGLAAGSAVWYVSAKDAPGGAAAFSGAVPAAETITLTVNQGNFNLFGNPFPVGLQLNNAEQVTWEGAQGTLDPQTADQIWIWNAITSGYEKWYYYFDENDHSYDGWWDLATATKLFEQVHPTGLDAGVPVWYVAQGTIGAENTFDVTFKTPLAK